MFPLTSLVMLLLILGAVGAVRYALLPALWGPITDPDPNQDECRPGGSSLSKHEHSGSGVVRVIRLTDDGEFADRCEFTDALYEIRNYKGPALIVWYIHGWKHSADDADSDLREFKGLVGRLDEQQQLLEAGDRRHVVGIYIGWDGAVGPRWLRNLTFWNRKRAADRISQSAVVTKVFAAAKFARQQAGERITAADLTIMIGHSFGARILYTATSQVLIQETQRRHPGRLKGSYGVIQGPADLILLLNPAFEASIFTAMHSMRRPDANTWERIDSRQQPLLLAISTENDWATGKAFPLGQRLEFARRERQRRTLGNYDAYVTHRLEPGRSDRTDDLSSAFWYDGFSAAGLTLWRNPEVRQPGNPFIVAKTTAEVMDGHGGIWGENLREWIVAFLKEVGEGKGRPPASRRARAGAERE